VGDLEVDVAKNRDSIRQFLGMPGEPLWLDQVHGNHVIVPELTGDKPGQTGDAAFTTCAGRVLTIMVADCLPILLVSQDGEAIGAVHGGWKGLAAGIIEETCARFSGKTPIIAWLGPCIGPCHYEVDEQVRRNFPESDLDAFHPGRDKSHWMLDLYQLAERRLRAAGIEDISGGNCCTYCESDRFFSYRRDGQTGRFAVFIWKD